MSVTAPEFVWMPPPSLPLLLPLTVLLVSATSPNFVWMPPPLVTEATAPEVLLPLTVLPVSVTSPEFE